LDELNDLARRCGDGAMADLANQVERRLRKVRFDLSVPIIHDMRVELRRLLQETLPLMYPESRQTRLSIDLAGLNHTHELEPACSVLLYRFVRGAASNVYRHAHARHIWVKSSHDGLRLNLSVSDDGIGFDPGQIEQFIDQDHYFFHDIQIRARQLGGELSIQSQPGAGASLEISVPVLAVDGASVIGNKTRRGSKASKHASH
jgi:signal transduction histidine kinase